ncbi:MAG: hypothetical protein IK054_00290, partial [Lachnospiraceae bacterium]|nr:hypothetical protein [Lachnospiraceae bacterium]
ISYQNKDIVSKVFADRFKGKSLSVYGLNVPRVADVLPTNLPDFSANELKIDNLFLLEDGSIAIIDYESKYSRKNRNKYINYISRVLKRYENEGIYDVKLRMIVIYTGDVSRDQVSDFYDGGALSLRIDSAFLSEIDSKEVRLRLEDKIKKGLPLSDEEMMEFIILPLTYKGEESQKKAAEEAVELVKQIQDEEEALFLLSGVIVFNKKKLNKNVLNNARRWLRMTDLGQLIEDEKQEAIKEAVNKVTKEKDAQLAQKDAEIMDLKAQLEALKKAPKA